MHILQIASYICVLSPLLLAGCSVATGKQFARHPTPTENEALIYIYRPHTLVGNADKPDIRINQASIGTLYAGGFLRTMVPLGQHTLTLTKDSKGRQWSYPDRSVKLPIIRSGVVYLRYTPTMRSGGYSGNQQIIIHSYKFEPVSEAGALEELSDLHQSE